jgi:hypothetical protein
MLDKRDRIGVTDIKHSHMRKISGGQHQIFVDRVGDYQYLFKPHCANFLGKQLGLWSSYRKFLDYG